jgi:tetratricopeptide (TPR) repeat protein
VLSRQGKYDKAEAMHRRALEGYKKVLGHKHPYTLTSVSNLGGVLFKQGKYDKAEAMHRRALEGYEKVLGRGHPYTLISVDNLCQVLSEQGKYDEAEVDIRMTREVLGPEHSDTLATIDT